MNLEVRECIENRQMNPSLASDMCKLSPSLNGNCQRGIITLPQVNVPKRRYTTTFGKCKLLKHPTIFLTSPQSTLLIGNSFLESNVSQTFLMLDNFD